LSDLDKIADSQIEEITKVIVEIKGELDIVEKSFNLLPHNESMPSPVQKKHSDECTKYSCYCEISENGFPCKEILN
jgi:hypothetical protein